MQDTLIATVVWLLLGPLREEGGLINICVCAYSPYKCTPLLSTIKYIRNHDFTQMHTPPIQQHRVYSGLATFIFIIIFFSGRIDFHYPHIHLFCSILACLYIGHLFNHPHAGLAPSLSSLYPWPARTSLHSLHGPELIPLPSWPPPHIYIYIFYIK